jgi:hypothetical protein
VILHRLDQGAQAECFYFLEPGRHPGFPLPSYAAQPPARALPMLFHQNGGFWHLDPVTGRESPLTPGAPLERLCQMPAHTRFAAESYPECWIVRTAVKLPHGTPASDMHTA